MSDPLPAVVDGVLRSDGRVDVLVLGGGLSFGEGLFETLPVVSGRPHFLDRHVRRITFGAETLGLLPAPVADTWAQDIQCLGDACGRSDLAVRLFLFRDGDRVRRSVTATILDPAIPAPARIGVVSGELSGPRPLGRMKTLNYLGPRRALEEGRAQNLDEVLFVLGDGTVLEGSRSTVFMVSGGVLRTASLDLPILPGVTREVLLELARGAGIGVREEGFTVEELESADEAFLSASLRGVRPVAEVLGHALGEAPGPVTARLQDLYSARVGDP